MGCSTPRAPPLLHQSLACHPSHIHRFAHHRVRQSLQRRTARPRLSPGRSPATAGLYNELLLKSGQDATGQKVSTNLQNAFMYTASILWLLLYLGVQGKLRDAVSAENLQGVARPVVVCIILIMSSVGTVTGFFLKYLDSVRKAVAGAVEVALATLAHTTPPPASRLSHMRPPRSHRSSSPPCSRGRSSAHRWTHSRCWRR